jgi:predicted lipoprotein with Yx(FWY)xxD motif
MKNHHVILLVLAVMGMLVIAGCTQQPAPSATTALPASQTTTAVVSDTIGTGNSSLGTILVDAGGRTLYYFAKDIPGVGKSACTGACAATWPAFSTDTIQVSSPLAKADFGTITRDDGTKQITYNGLPLYYYKGDSSPGDVNGDGINKIWFAVTPFESLLIAQSPALGTYLTDSHEKTLYFYTGDTPGNSACTGSCLAQFPAYSANLLSLPSSLNPKDFSKVTRTDGVQQIAYKGMPLYYYAGDKHPGDVNGQNYSLQWFAANVSGIAAVSTLGTPQPMNNPGY